MNSASSPEPRKATKEEKAVCRACKKPILPTDPVLRHATFGPPSYGVSGLRSHATCVGYRFQTTNPCKA